MSNEPGYGDYIQLRDETDANSNVIKVKAMMIHPEMDGKKRGICEKITYNNEGVAIAWNYPRFVDFKISFTGTDYILVPAN